MLSLAACDDEPDRDAAPTTSSAPAPSDDVIVHTERTSFEPSEVVARPGGELSIVNDDEFSHTFTIDDAGIDVELRSGESATTAAPAEPGRYEVRCRIHRPMRGALVVEPG